jgi:starch synthase
VLIEASALAVPIAAMDTGGTSDIVEDEVTGLLSTSPEELAGDVRRLRSDQQLRARLGAAATVRARERFEASAVAARVDALYQDLLQRSADR